MPTTTPRAPRNEPVETIHRRQLAFPDSGSGETDIVNNARHAARFIRQSRRTLALIESRSLGITAHGVSFEQFSQVPRISMIARDRRKA